MPQASYDSLAEIAEGNSCVSVKNERIKGKLGNEQVGVRYFYIEGVGEYPLVRSPLEFPDPYVYYIPSAFSE